MHEAGGPLVLLQHQLRVFLALAREVRVLGVAALHPRGDSRKLTQLDIQHLDALSGLYSSLQ